MVAQKGNQFFSLDNRGDRKPKSKLYRPLHGVNLSPSHGITETRGKAFIFFRGPKLRYEQACRLIQSVIQSWL